MVISVQIAGREWVVVFRSWRGGSMSHESIAAESQQCGNQRAVVVTNSILNMVIMLDGLIKYRFSDII